MTIAVAIGLHNLAEGLAIGVSAKAGAIGLATLVGQPAVEALAVRAAALVCRREVVFARRREERVHEQALDIEPAQELADGS